MLKSKQKKDRKAKGNAAKDQLGLPEGTKNSEGKEDTVNSNLRDTRLNTEELLDLEKTDAMKNQGYFNQLTLKQKRSWFGTFRRNYVDFKTNRKYTIVFIQRVCSRSLKARDSEGN